MDSLAQQSSSVIAILAIVVVVAIVLVGVVIVQQRKIKDLQTPRYGFLGKSLNLFVIGAVLVGGLGFVYLSNNNDHTFTEVSADLNIDANIIITEIDSLSNTYEFNVIPTIDGREWGGSSEYNFNVYWTLSSEENDYSQVELGLIVKRMGE